MVSRKCIENGGQSKDTSEQRSSTKKNNEPATNVGTGQINGRDTRNKSTNEHQCKTKLRWHAHGAQKMRSWCAHTQKCNNI